MKEAPLLALRDVVFGYDPARPVLNGVTLELWPGERVGLMGRNGAGKSTLLQILVGLLHPQRGAVEFRGRACSTEADFREVRREVGLVFQNADDQLFCPTVIEDVAFGPLNLGRSPAEALQDARAALERVGLVGFEDRITHHLSAGEKKLVALASVLAMKPTALLLDEPTAGLDDFAEAKVREIIVAWPGPLLLVSQDHHLLQALPRRLFQLDGGRLHPLQIAVKS